MTEKYYLVKLLTNDQGQDGSSLAVYNKLDNAIVAYHQTLAAYHNAQDVRFANVSIINAYGVTISGYSETVEHIPAEDI